MIKADSVNKNSLRALSTDVGPLCSASRELNDLNQGMLSPKLLDHLLSPTYVTCH